MVAAMVEVEREGVALVAAGVAAEVALEGVVAAAVLSQAPVGV